MHPLYCSVQNILERTWLSPLHGRGAQGGKAALECQCPAGSPATSRTVDVGRAQGIIFLFCGSQRLARLGTFISAHVPFHVHHTPFALQRDMSSSHPGPPPLHYKVSPAGRARDPRPDRELQPLTECGPQDQLENCVAQGRAPRVRAGHGARVGH